MLPLVEVSVGLTVAATILLATSESLSRIALLGLLVASAAPIFDLLDLTARLRMRSAARARAELLPTAQRSDQLAGQAIEYSVAASVHNAEHEIPEFLDASAPYRGKLWLIDDASTDQTATLLRSRGVRCLRSDRNGHKPSAIKRLVARLPETVQAIVVLDPDTRLRAADGGPPPLEAVIQDMLAHGHAAVCPRVTVKRENLLTSLQAFEYALAVTLGRAALGDLSVTSGISFYRRSDLEEALARHSLSVYAEDLENTVILLAADKSIVLDERVVAETDGKSTLGALFSQRIGWAYGHLRVYWERKREILRIARRSPIALYQYLVYLGLVSIVLHPVRQIGALLVGASLLGTLGFLLGAAWIPQTGVANPILFATVFLQYSMLSLLAVMVAVPRAERWRSLPLVPLFPIYALMLTVPVSIGFLNCVTVRLLGRRIVDDHYVDTERLVTGRPPVVRRPLPEGAVV